LRILITAITFAITLVLIFSFRDNSTVSDQIALINNPIQTKGENNTPEPQDTFIPEEQIIAPLVVKPPQTTAPVIRRIPPITLLNPPLIFKVKEDANVRITASAGSVCEISVKLPSGSKSKAQGLEPKTANQTGYIEWIWSIHWNTKPGSGTIEINCQKDSQTWSETFNLELTS